jgi:hypothetical protein
MQVDCPKCYSKFNSPKELTPLTLLQCGKCNHTWQFTAIKQELSEKVVSLIKNINIGDDAIEARISKIRFKQQPKDNSKPTIMGNGVTPKPLPIAVVAAAPPRPTPAAQPIPAPAKKKTISFDNLVDNTPVIPAASKPEEVKIATAKPDFLEEKEYLKPKRNFVPQLLAASLAAMALLMGYKAFASKPNLSFDSYTLDNVLLDVVLKNNSSKKQQVPNIKIIMLDNNGKLISEQLYNPKKNILEGGDEIAISLNNLDSRIKKVKLKLDN